MIIKEIHSKTILSPSKIYPYVINPYTGCQHNCLYCYARFMKKYTGHEEPWGQFVDVKINAPDLLMREVVKKKIGTIWISGVCDPYQPLEEKYKLTRKCLEILVEHNWPVVIQTRSSLVLRDMDILMKGKSLEAGLSITTADDNIRKLFEPNAPSIEERINTLDELHKVGIRTYAMIAPMLPKAEELAEMLDGKVDYVLFDRMNYHYADWVYQKYNLLDKLTDDYFYRTKKNLSFAFVKLGIS
ncbi:MAG: radical SAM protein [Ignavibacteriales bacterium]|nr:MAG: radical SAM protein [Ignavibacteriales bacterium]